jgi:hypothetical protein
MTKAVIEITAAVCFWYLLVASLIYECRDCSSNCGESCAALLSNAMETNWVGIVVIIPQDGLPSRSFPNYSRIPSTKGCYLSRGGGSFQSLHHRTGSFILL